MDTCKKVPVVGNNGNDEGCRIIKQMGTFVENWLRNERMYSFSTSPQSKDKSVAVPIRSQRYYFSDSSNSDDDYYRSPLNSSEEDDDDEENDTEIQIATGTSSTTPQRSAAPEVNRTGRERQMERGREIRTAVATNSAPARANNDGDNVDSDDSDDEGEESFVEAHPFYVLLIAFVSYLIILYVIYSNFPEVGEVDRKYIKIPRNMEEAKALAIVLDRHTGQHYWAVLFTFCSVYLFLQTFIIPGSIFLSIMSGFLFPFQTAVFLCCFCASTGGLGCYTLSWLLGRKLIRKHFPDEIRVWSARVEQERENLLNFMIFLRITPILPNWFINLAAPLIGVPPGVFWLGSFIGFLPPSVLAVQGGKTLNVMTSPTDHISWTAIIVLALIALLSLIPVFLRRSNDNGAPAPTTNT